MPSSRTIPLLIAGMLMTGISNSLLNKYQDMQCVENCSALDESKQIKFEQPVWQTLQMFVGECLCLVPIVYSWGKVKWDEERRRRIGKTTSTSTMSSSNGGAEYQTLPTQDEQEIDDDTTTQQAHPSPPQSTRSSIPLPLLFFAPAVFDILGTTLMNVGLLFTPVSIYQMTRGALVLWVGIFSVIFLGRHLYLFQWLMLVTVMLGVSVVGLSGTILKEVDETVASPSAVIVNRKRDDEGQQPDVPPAVTALLGVLLILFAQLFTASQFVLEEKIMARYEVDPLLAVGYEGLWGFFTVLLSMPLLHLFIGSTPSGRGGYFDIPTGFHQMISSPTIIWTSVAIAISIALFNGCGLAVTRAISATARSTIDTCRTLGIWVISLLLGWEVFKPLSGSLQSLGFVLLVYGTLVFNGIVRPPRIIRPRIETGSGDHERQRQRDQGQRRSRSRSKGRHRSTSRRPKAVATTTTTGGHERQIQRASAEQEEQRSQVQAAQEHALLLDLEHSNGDNGTRSRGT